MVRGSRARRLVPAAPARRGGTVTLMTNYEDTVSIGKVAAWNVLEESCFGVLWKRLAESGLAGENDGAPAWVDWQRLQDAEALLDAQMPLSGGLRAVLQIVVALARIDDQLPMLDRRNRLIIATELDAVQYQLRHYDELLGRSW
jgi:hypothetical protein